MEKRTLIRFFTFPDPYLKKLGYENIISLSKEKIGNRTTENLSILSPLSWLMFICRIALLVTSKKARVSNTYPLVIIDGIYLGQTNPELESIAETPDNAINKEWVRIHTSVGLSDWPYLYAKIPIDKNSPTGIKWASLCDNGAPVVILVSVNEQGKELKVEDMFLEESLPVNAFQTLTVVLQTRYPLLLAADPKVFDKLWFSYEHQLQVHNGIHAPVVSLKNV
jgi:hypothetical protein